MTPEDETELHRLAAMLEQIDKTLPGDSPLREALQKAGYSLSYSFMDGRRRDIEGMYSVQDAELSPHQRGHLESLGINPDQNSCRTDETD